MFRKLVILALVYAVLIFSFVFGVEWWRKKAIKEIALRGPPPIGIKNEAGMVRLCLVPSERSAVICWGYPSPNSGNSPHSTQVVMAKAQYCCPDNVDSAFTVPDGTAGYYVGRNGRDEVRQFEKLPTGAYGGGR